MRTVAWKVIEWMRRTRESAEGAAVAGQISTIVSCSTLFLKSDALALVGGEWLSLDA